MKQFLQGQGTRIQFRTDFDLHRVCSVTLLGIGGRTIDKMIRYDRESICATAPNTVVLEVGTNDLCDYSTDPENVGESTMAFAEIINPELDIQHMIIRQVISRRSIPSRDIMNE